MKRAVVLLAFALGLSACLGSDFQDSLEAAWEMTSGSIGAEEISPPDTHPISISFAGRIVGGTASCNGYGGEYRVSGSSLVFGDLFITEAACAPPETMAAESLFMQALALVDTVEIGGGTLKLSGPGTVLEFEMIPPVPEAELLNTVWVLDGLISGDAVTSVAGDRATLEFFSDGSVLGATGCRTVKGQYQVNGAEVEVNQLSADGDCDPSLSGQDSHVVSVLESGFRVEIAGNRMTLSLAGEEGLRYLGDD